MIRNIGDTKEPFCNDPTHDEYCDCGATPDLDYERGLDI